MKKKLTMKQIFIPVAIVVVILAIVAVILSKTGDTSGGASYHTHANGETHYDSTTTTQEYHTHEDGVTHYGEH